MTPLLDFRGMLGRGSDGIFGLQYMAGYCVEFDLKEGWMRAVSPDTLRQAGFVRYPLEEENGRLYLPVRVRAAGREVEGRFLLDTGSPGTLSMTRSGLGGRIVPAGCGFVSDDIGRCRGECRIAVFAGGFGLVLRQ